MTDAGKRGGVLLRVDGSLRFVPASVAVRVAPAPRISPVPGAPPELLGIAMHEGSVIPVVAIGAARLGMTVCHYAGELLGLVGGEIIKAGWFAAVPDKPDVVEHDGEHASALDLGAIYARVQSGSRPPR